MRSFPSAPRRRAAVACAATLLCGLSTLAVAPARADRDLQGRQQQLQERVAHVQNGIDDASDAAARAAARLDRAQARLADARNRLEDLRARVTEAVERNQELQEQLRLSRQQLTNARASLAAGQAAVGETRDDAAATITSIYEGTGDPGLRTLSSFLSAGTLEDIEREQQTEDLIVDEQTSAYDAVQSAEASLVASETAVQEATATVATRKAEAQDVVETLRTLRASAVAARNTVRGSVEASRSARQDALAARARDQAALADLRQREEKVRQQILAAARAAARADQGYTGATDALLDYPASGSVTSPFGYREHPIYHYWGLHDGVDLGVACGQPLMAVADGTVISQYYSEVYGNRLYLSLGNVNGKNLTAVYNHASSYTLGVGDTVSRGATLGFVGDTGWSTGCHLHFTVLENGVAVDPMRYL